MIVRSIRPLFSLGHCINTVLPLHNTFPIYKPPIESLVICCPREKWSYNIHHVPHAQPLLTPPRLRFNRQRQIKYWKSRQYHALLVFYFHVSFFRCRPDEYCSTLSPASGSWVSWSLILEQCCLTCLILSWAVLNLSRWLLESDRPRPTCMSMSVKMLLGACCAVPSGFIYLFIFSQVCGRYKWEAENVIITRKGYCM